MQVYNYQTSTAKMPITYHKDELDEITEKIFMYKYGEKYEKN